MSSQSALQIHPAAARTARSCAAFRVDEDGELLCHWDPIIPFAGARRAARYPDVDRARLYWSDGLMSGRVSRGEA